MQNIWERIVRRLIDTNQTITTMESCTGGGIVNEITNISGASQILKVSYITYSNEVKIKYGVNKEIIDRYSVYSKETATEMAKCAMNNASSNWAIGVTGQLGRKDPANNCDTLDKVWYTIVNNKGNVFSYEIEIEHNERSLQKKSIINQIAYSLEKVLDFDENVIKM